MRANLITNGEARATAGRRRANTDHAEGVGDPRAETEGSHGRVPQDRPRAQEALNGPLSSGFDQVAEHPVPVLTAVVAPRPLVQVALKPFVRDGVMRATDATFEQAEEPVDGLRMHVPVNVDPGLVLDPAVRVALLAKPLVGRELVREDHR